MKNKKIIAVLTAATLLLSLCGFFMSRREERNTPVFASREVFFEAEPFSLEKARELLHLCAAASYPESLEAMMKEQEFESFMYKENKQQGVFGSGIAFGLCLREKASGEFELTVVFRGTEGEEWYSNFAVGEGTVHAGFESAAKFARRETDSYLEKRGIHKAQVTLTLTGHSRGGAAANILAKEYLEEGRFRNVCAYTFASPRVTVKMSSPHYRGIYNIVNPEDFICYLPLESWGYKRFGTDIPLPSNIKGEDSALYKKMQEDFFARCGFPHKGYENGKEDVEEMIRSLSTLCPTPRDFSEREIRTPSKDVTLTEYMNCLSCVLSGETPVNSALFILSCLEECSLSPITDLLLEGISLKNLNKSDSLTQGALFCSHTPEVYKAWLSVLTEEYFLKFTENSP